MNQARWPNKQLDLPKVSTRVRLVIVSAFLALTLLITILASGDPNWGRWHISYLGEAQTFSAHYFNMSMWVAALLVFWLSLSFRRDLEALKTSHKRFRRVKPLVVQLGLVVMAVCVYLVGLFPRSYGIFPHDIFGHIIYFAFLGLCLASPWILPGFSRRFYVISYLFHALMMVIFITYWAGIHHSLYAAEVATFVFFLGWLWLVSEQPRPPKPKTTSSEYR